MIYHVVILFLLPESFFSLIRSPKCHKVPLQHRYDTITIDCASTDLYGDFDHTAFDFKKSMFTVTPRPGFCGISM